MDQLTLIRIPRNDHTQSITLPVCFPGVIESQVRLLFRHVRPVAGKALRSQNRQNLPVVFYLRSGGQQTAEKDYYT